MKRLGYGIASAAVLVHMARLLQSHYGAGRVELEPDGRRLLLMIAAAGTAVVLTGGQLYLMHAIATTERWRAALVVIWLGILTASAGMVVPAIEADLAGVPMHQIVTQSDALRRGWALLAALGHELTAAGCLLAAAAAAPERRSVEHELQLWSERDEARERAERAEREVTALRAALELAPSAAEPAARAFACERCDRTFQTQQARSGHQRSCKGSQALTSESDSKEERRR